MPFPGAFYLSAKTHCNLIKLVEIRSRRERFAADWEPIGSSNPSLVIF
jgi:hypothetical protein